jgi:hypothetical protein
MEERLFYGCVLTATNETHHHGKMGAFAVISSSFREIGGRVLCRIVPKERHIVDLTLGSVHSGRSLESILPGNIGIDRFASAEQEGGLSEFAGLRQRFTFRPNSSCNFSTTQIRRAL